MSHFDPLQPNNQIFYMTANWRKLDVNTRAYANLLTIDVIQMSITGYSESNCF